MTALTFSLICISIVLIIYSLILIEPHCKEFFEFRREFKRLPSYTFYKEEKQIYGVENEAVRFVWFTDENVFIIRPNVIILRYLNPAHSYWNKRILKWCQENIKDVPEYVVKDNTIVTVKD